MIFLGRDRESEEPLYVDDSHSRAVLICGKRGSGKSYTMGVFLEELIREEGRIVIALDPMRNFHTMVLPNLDQEEMLWDWGINPSGVPVRLLVPGDPIRRYGREIVEAFKKRNVEVRSLRVNPGDLMPETWLDLFDLDMTKPMGIALYRAVYKLRGKYDKDFYMSEIIEEVKRSSRASESTIEALLLRLETAANEWDIFSTRYHELSEVFAMGVVNVIDLGALEISRFGLRNLIALLITRDLFRKRRDARLKEELGLTTEVPKVWLAIDEAQEFVPSGRTSLAKETLIQWVKEGRQPGLSLIVASQQPSAIDSELLSQCDLILAHKVTNMEDVLSLNKLSHDYMSRELSQYMRQLMRIGEAVMVDDEKETVSIVQVRPRRSKHGGAEL